MSALNQQVPTSRLSVYTSEISTKASTCLSIHLRNCEHSAKCRETARWTRTCKDSEILKQGCSMDKHFSQKTRAETERCERWGHHHSPANCAPPRRESNLSEVPAGWCEESAKRHDGRDHSHRMRTITRGKVRKRRRRSTVRVGERSVWRTDEAQSAHRELELLLFIPSNLHLCLRRSAP